MHAAIQFALGLAILCHERRSGGAEEQRSAVWLMLQPHPLDQRHNYIVISWLT